MLDDTIDMTSADLEKQNENGGIANAGLPYGGLASSNRYDEEDHISINSPDAVRSSKDAHAIGVQSTNEPDPGGILATVLSKTTSRISVDPGPPPDGGLVAWTQVLMGHLIVFNTWGYIVSYGVFQTYYVTTLGHPPSDISWVRNSQEGSLELP